MVLLEKLICTGGTFRVCLEQMIEKRGKEENIGMVKGCIWKAEE